MKVLLYETEDQHIQILQEYLNKEDYELVVEQDDQKVIEHFEGEDDLPELIISNFNLPAGGIELVNNLLAALKPPFPYVLFLTDSHSEQYAVDCLGPIPGDFVTKPLRMEELRARISVAERAIALQNHLRTQQEIPPDIALYDNLTNLLNRQAVYERVLGEVNRAQREKSPVCLGVFEIININEIKEKYGQKIAEHAIRFIARSIRANVRMYDIVGRWAEERFLLMLPGLRPEFTKNVFSRIYGAIHSVRIRLEDDSLLELKVAAGYTASPAPETAPLYLLIEQANTALQQAAKIKGDTKISRFESIEKK